MNRATIRSLARSLTRSAQARQASSPSSEGSIREGGSFAAHLKTIEKKIPLRSRSENLIGGKWVAPAKGGYFDNISPTTGQVIYRIARSQAEDVERAIDAAHAVADHWGRSAVAERARILNRVADAARKLIEQLKETTARSCFISPAAAATGARPCAFRWESSNWAVSTKR
jgi:Aldehyde dehydrogenase family